MQFRLSGVVIDPGLYGVKKPAQVAAHMGGQFSSDKIQCLDAVGPFIDLGNAGISGVLFDASITNIAVTTVDLDA